MSKTISSVIAVLALLFSVQSVHGQSDETAFEVTTSGDDRFLAIAVIYTPSGDRAVSSVVCDAEALTKTGQTGSCYCSVQIELWTKINPSSGVVPVTVTMSEACDVKVCAIPLSGVDQTTPIDIQQINVGDNVTDAVAVPDGGDATLIMLLSTPETETISTPSGFVTIGSNAGEGDYRASGFWDDDASEDSAALSFSDYVGFASFILGVNDAP
jgi:hypothetical protein